MAGFRSLLAKWLGGAGSDVSQGGFRSLLAFWLGGASQPVEQAEAEQVGLGGAGGASSGGDHFIYRRTPYGARGRCDVNAPWLIVSGRGRYEPPAVTGRCEAALRLTATASGAYEPPAVTGRGQVRMRLNAQGVGRTDNTIPMRIKAEDEWLLLDLVA